MRCMSKNKCACVQLKFLTLLYANVIWTSPLQVFPPVRADHLKSVLEPCRSLSGGHCAAAAAAAAGFSHSVTVSLPFSLWMLWPIFCVGPLLGFSCMLQEFVSFLFLILRSKHATPGTMTTLHFSPGTHPAKAPCLLSCGAISRARRVAGCRAGLGGEVRRFVAVARLQSCYGNGQSSVLTSPTLPYPPPICFRW